ncbi:hypothetical protein IFM89_021753 [Coptis chinensis]|uniref:Uncharacterized protein n=1 Tax=Coptis chinensis TaxID=261450 RepID=A0A835LIX3_9MAGN|nr:hypothetical protein IFM89_021753 [Coptis chinensis]
MTGGKCGKYIPWTPPPNPTSIPVLSSSDGSNKLTRKRDPRLTCENFLAGRIPCSCPELDEKEEEAEIGIGTKRPSLMPLRFFLMVEKRYCQQAGKCTWVWRWIVGWALILNSLIDDRRRLVGPTSRNETPNESEDGNVSLLAHIRISEYPEWKCEVICNLW